MAEKLTVNLAGNIVHEHIGDISVLLIDNDTTSVTSLTSMLEQFSYKVMSVNVASEAVSMIGKQNDIGLVIANIEMPHIDSHSFFTALLHKEIPLILITPETNTKKASDLLTKSTCFYLKKPISENDIKNLWQHVVPKKCQELEKINIDTQKEKSILKQIESFRETIKRQRTSQSSLLGRRPFIKRFTTSETYQKRKGIAIDEGKTKPVYPTDEAENKREEGKKIESNVERRCNLWTRKRHMKFLTAISILGEKDSCPKSILRIMNDSTLNHHQVRSHLQKYKFHVEQMSDTLSRNEWRSTDKTFDYPSDYEYPFSASNLTENLIESYSKWYSLRKNESSSSSIVQYSFKKSADKSKAKLMLKFLLGGKLDLGKHSLSGNELKKSPKEVNYVPSATSHNPPSNISPTNDVNHSGLSSGNPPVLSGLLSSTGAFNTNAVQMESLEICIPQAKPNPFQSPSLFVLETGRNQLDLDPIYIPDPYIPQADTCPMEENYLLLDPNYTMNPLKTNMGQMGLIPSTENISHHETTNTNHVGFVSGQTSSEVPPQTNMAISETNTDQMDWLFSKESLLVLENMNSFETNTAQSLETNRKDMGNCGSSVERIPLSTSYIGHDSAFNTPTDSIPHITMEDHDQSLAMNLESTSQQHNMMESCRYQNIEAANPRETMEGRDHCEDDPECMDWIDAMLNKNA